MKTTRWLVLGTLLSTAVGTTGAQVTLTRTDFALSEWEQVVLENSTGLGISPSAPSSGGNIGSYLQLDVASFETSGQQQRAVQAAYINSGLIYNPGTSGAISSLNFGFDVRRFVGLSNGSGGSVAPLLRQGGEIFVFSGSLTNFSQNNWTPLGFDLAASNSWRTLSSAAVNPNFSVTGGVMEFGFRYSTGGLCSANVGQSCTSTQFQVGLDNYTVTITPASTTVPEPSTVALLAVGLAGIVTVSRRRRLTVTN